MKQAHGVFSAARIGRSGLLLPIESAFSNLIATAICFSLGSALVPAERRSPDSWSDHAGGGGH
jgi:hypothetical protein